ncbi:MAG: FG-GAP-like repeat-containing protein, partial [Bacteroidales bacterium]|nr:FG-GAP-like repeat-containing protein [Bacteroidales bacterium]
MKFKNYFSILFLLLYNVTCYSQYEVGEFSGESNVNEMGAATYSLPFDIPSGINGLQPSLGIVYNSQSGNGIAGMGTSLLGLSVISRTPKDIFHDGTAKGISYSTTDAYTKNGARLLLKSGSEGMSGSVYCTEGMPYNNITLMGSGQSQYFIAEQADGSKAYYGTNTIFPITDEPTAWYLDKVVDVYGNTITYNYTRHGSCVYISTIVYGTNETTATNFSATISFEYEGRIDTIKSAHRGITCNLSRRLKTVTIQTTQGTSSTTWYKYKFSYMYLDSFSRLDKITKSYENSDLPPITFTWSKLTGFSLGRTGLQNFGTLVAYNGTTNIDITGTDKVNQYFFTGNFLANEKEDIVLATFYNNYTYLNVYEYQSNGTFRLRANNDIAADSIDFRQLGNYVGDLDGDGYSEIIMPCTSTDSFKIYASTDIRWQNASGNAVYPAGSNYSRPLTKVFSEKITSFSPCTPIHTLGDFYNCGRSQIIYVETQLNPSMRYTCKLLMKNTDGTQSVSSFNMYVPNAPRRLIASDFNGDGLQDLLVLQRTGYQIYINQGSAAGTMPFVETAKVYGGDLCEVQNVLTGDFNGDGMLDFLTEAEHDDNWYFYFGNGNGTFTKKLACSLPNCTDKSYTERDNNKLQCYVTDFDNDGKQDVIMTKAFYEKKTQLFPKKEWGEYKETYTYWMKSTGYSLIQQKRTTTSNVNDALPAHFVAGDFDGDGFIEYIKYGGDILNATTTTSNWNFYKNSTLTPASNKITKISTPNHGTETIFSYASLADGNVYTKGANSQYPLLDVTLPIHVVKRTTLKAGGWTNTKDYTYSGLRIHLQGRGLLGFTTTSVYDQNSDTRITNTITSLDTDFYIPTGICSSTQTAETTSSCLTTISVNRRNS